jgi:hypothetical protein
VAGENGNGTEASGLPIVRVEVGIDGTGPGRHVVITEVTPQSTHVLKLSPATARSVADLMHQAAGRVASGLVLPPSAN